MIHKIPAPYLLKMAKLTSPKVSVVRFYETRDTKQIMIVVVFRSWTLKMIKRKHELMMSILYVYFRNCPIRGMCPMHGEITY